MNSHKYDPGDFTPTEKIEILSVDLLDQQRPLVEDLKDFARLYAWNSAGTTC